MTTILRNRSELLLVLCGAMVWLAAGPAMKSTVSESDTPPTMAVMIAVPTFVGLVRVADAMPPIVSAEAVIVPAVVLKFTRVPSGTLLLFESLTVAFTSAGPPK